MNRPYYSEYVRHALRFYTRNPIPLYFKGDADKANWYACAAVIKKYPDRDRNILMMVYGDRDTLSDNVYNAAKKYDVHQNSIWDMMKEFERKVAKMRGLL